MKKLHQLVFATAMVLVYGFAGPPALARQASMPAGQAALSDGEIKKIDKVAGKLTIQHGELRNLGMPGMTMMFKVGDAAMLDQVKVGEKVRFVADKVGGALTVTFIETADYQHQANPK
nr:copper-binding protein [uncultured Duganella sp.]